MRVYTISVTNPAGPPPIRLAPGKPEDHRTHLSPTHAPSFYITGRQPLSPGAILLAIVIAVGALSLVLYAMSHAGRASRLPRGALPARTTMTIQIRSTPSSSAIPTDAPVPARPGTTSAPFTPLSSFACLASATSSALSPTPPPATSSTTGLPPSIRQAIPHLRKLCPTSLPPPRPPHRWSSGGRPAASACSLPKRSSPASSSSGFATRPPQQPKPSAPSRCVQTPAPPPSRASASAPFPHPATTPGPLLPRLVNRDEPAIARDPDSPCLVGDSSTRNESLATEKRSHRLNEGHGFSRATCRSE